MKLKTRDMILAALFAALTAVGAYLVIPTQPVPITLQILFCMYSGVLLGSKLGLMSQIIYFLMGIIGLPVFANGASGFGYVFQPTFGYLIGFIICGYITGKISERIQDVRGIKGFIYLLIAVISGLTVVYAVGIPYLYMIFNVYKGNAITLNTALKWGFYPFIAQDLVKCIIVALTAVKVLPALRRAGYVSSSKGEMIL